ncbi:hypothetical protein LMH87_005943 [Akanthomyces muscarius]|uniref:Uncharacterized protein n=1 Tax=Akanthomyces muscarius TaxID=2231603 RepID=A0A9W8QMU1_AKAMU|nr:hypothetical protein LMH87_005943 [Akanthomyces muscarius]KAJ4164263.1 hypothetical protein LMH87_005943 [Akanthomyces muscarius]
MRTSAAVLVGLSSCIASTTAFPRIRIYNSARDAADAALAAAVNVNQKAPSYSVVPLEPGPATQTAENTGGNKPSSTGGGGSSPSSTGSGGGSPSSSQGAATVTVTETVTQTQTHDAVTKYVTVTADPQTVTADPKTVVVPTFVTSVVNNTETVTVPSVVTSIVGGTETVTVPTTVVEATTVLESTTVVEPTTVVVSAAPTTLVTVTTVSANNDLEVFHQD